MGMEGEEAVPREVLAKLQEILARRASEYEGEWKRRWLSSVFDPDALHAHNRLVLANAKFNDLDPRADDQAVLGELAQLQTAIRQAMELMETRIIWPRPWRQTMKALKKDERASARHARFRREWAEVRRQRIPYEEFGGSSD
jgi:hypothetical protein